VVGEVSYDGITPEHLTKHYRGGISLYHSLLCPALITSVDVAYSPEDDTHFPSLSVKNTLAVAAKMRTPQNRVMQLSRPEFVQSE
jgi:ATP-binding cassette subfamily G (WHITE) protein 2 (SNQ2)